MATSFFRNLKVQVVPVDISDSESFYSIIDDDPHYIPNDTDNVDESSSNESGTVSIIDGGDTEEISTTGYPSENCRINNTIKLLLPITDAIYCTEKETTCSFSSDQNTYSKVHTNLRRHLRRKHGIIIDRLEKWCIYCKSPILMKHGTLHACLQDLPPSIRSKKQIECPKCDRSFHNRRQFNNHRKKHLEDEQREKINQTISKKKRPKTPPPSHEDPLPEQSQSISTQDSISATQNYPNIDDEENELIGEIYEEDTEVNPSNNNNNDDENFDENILPDPETECPSDPFIKKFKPLLLDYSDDKWPQFIDLLNEFPE